VCGRLADKFVLQPARDPLEVFVAVLDHAGVHEDLADVALVVTRRQFVEQLVADRAALGRELGQQAGGRSDWR
jgi:hypothetical protein